MTSTSRDCTSLSVRVATIYEMVKSESAAREREHQD